jgi:hypothetical protein
MFLFQTPAMQQVWVCTMIPLMCSDLMTSLCSTGSKTVDNRLGLEHILVYHETDVRPGKQWQCNLEATFVIQLCKISFMKTCKLL